MASDIGETNSHSPSQPGGTAQGTGGGDGEAQPSPREPEPEIYALQERPSGHSTESLAEQLSNLPEPSPPSWREKRGIRKPQDGETWALLGCNLLVFATSVCIMVLELTASRLIARQVGSSLYTWTSVIGVVLAGITIGNAIGGILADRFSAARTLGWLFFLSSVACFSVLWLDHLPEAIGRPTAWSWPAWILAVVTMIFLWPAVALGTISPVVASMALRRSARTGVTVGNVYAWGAFGSIVGTFLTGFWLTDQFGTRQIIAITAAMLAVLGAIVATGSRAFRVAVVLAWLQFVGIVGLAATTTAATAGEWGLTLGEWLSPSSTRLPEQVRQKLLSEIRSPRSNGRTSSEKTWLLQWLAENPPESLDGATVERLRLWLSGVSNRLDPAAIPDVSSWLAGPARNEKAAGWQDFAGRLGGHLHEIGRLLKLRDDSPIEYHDESSYSYINVGETTEGGAAVRYLKLDKLIHSYWNPNDPTAIYYDYEKIYAGVTELAVAERAGQTESALDALPVFRSQEVAAEPAPDEALLQDDDSPAMAELPDERPPGSSLPESRNPNPPQRTPLADRVEFDAARRQLRIAGGMSEALKAELLSRSSSSPFWAAVESLERSTSRSDFGGFETVPLDALPEGVEIPAELQRTLRYDHLVRALNAYGRITPADRDLLLGLGPDGAYRRAVDELFARSRRVSAFFIGGGGFVFPRWIEARFPQEPRIDVAELDPAVKLAVQAKMGLPPDGETAIRTRIGDARNVIDDHLRLNAERETAGQTPVLYDFVYGDAFNDFSVPWHLTTREFSEKVRALLSPEGVYLVNLIDLYPRTIHPSTTLKNVTVSFQGVLPPEVGSATTSDWSRSKLDGLLVRKTGPRSYELRSPEPMTDDVLSTLHHVARRHAQLNDAVHRLYNDSRGDVPYAGTVPAALIPQADATEWNRGPSPFESFQVREVVPRDERGASRLFSSEERRYVLGYRGAMPAGHRDALKRLEPGNQAFAAAVDDLSARSRQRGPGRFLGSFVKTANAVFPNVYVFSSEVGEPHDDRDTFVIVCSMRPLPMERLQKHSAFWQGAPFAARETDPADGVVRETGQMEAVVELSEGVELTDDYAPVDNMLSPIFSGQRQ